MDRPVIHVGKSRIIKDINGSRLETVIKCFGEDKNVYFSVSEEFSEYLTDGRADAYVIGLLNFAMRHGLDIECEDPVSSQLLFQVRDSLIPALTSHCERMYPSRILCRETDRTIESCGGIGCGISCGVDSLHILKKHGNGSNSPFPITHVTLNKVGAMAIAEGQFDKKVEHTRKFCEEYGYKLIVIDTNFNQAFRQDHLLSHTFTNVFCVYALQKFWRVFFYGSSGHDFSRFSIVENAANDAGLYDLLSLDSFSQFGLRLYSEGSALTRYEKLKELIDYEPAQRHLDVCGQNTGVNCNKCEKCKRTMVLLDALEGLEKFSHVFDIDYYRSKRPKFLKWLYGQKMLGGLNADFIDPAYQRFKGEIGLGVKLRQLIALSRK